MSNQHSAIGDGPDLPAHIRDLLNPPRRSCRRKSKYQDAIVQLLGDHGTLKVPHLIAGIYRLRGWDVTPNNMRGRLRSLAAAGVVDNPRHGWYCLSEKGWGLYEGVRGGNA